MMRNVDLVKGTLNLTVYLRIMAVQQGDDHKLLSKKTSGANEL